MSLPQRCVVAGAGVAGLSSAMQLARALSSQGSGRRQVFIVDPRPPMTATSSVSTECYRSFFLDPVLTPFIAHSIDVLESLQQKHGFLMGRRGYAFLCGSQSGRDALRKFGETASAFGAGEVREHPAGKGVSGYVHSPLDGWEDERMTGFDLVEGEENVQAVFPFVSKEANTILHCRRAGWLDAYGLGTAYLRDAKMQEGVEVKLVQGRVVGVDKSGGQVSAVQVEGGERLECDVFVNAAGPWAEEISNHIAPHAPLPLHNEIHSKVMLHDVESAVPQSAPMMIWRDGVELPWDDDWRDALVELDDTASGGHTNARTWLDRQPGGAHLRPCGNSRVLLLWEHVHRHIDVPVKNAQHPPTEQLLHEMYPELCSLGLAAMVPALAQYQGNIPRGTVVDGGFYTTTPDGRPVIGPYGASNAVVCCGFNGWGIMASAAAGDLAARHALGLELPEYAAALELPCPPPRARPPVDLLDESVGDEGDEAEEGEHFSLIQRHLSIAEQLLKRAGEKGAKARSCVREAASCLRAA
eukprot:Hpha_TRINITY_DN16167_c1_g2::TRINITY_DN16167_c1_g2_i2::g.5931::m.5931